LVIVFETIFEKKIVGFYEKLAIPLINKIGGQDG